MLRSGLLLSALLASVALPTAAATNADLVQRGEYLVTVGDCTACHSAPNGQPFSGGLALTTPFGVIVTPNITPDRETGIGDWTDEQFYRAMHEGIGQDGENLYPVFPYTSYTKVTRDDVLAIKAYLFSLQPVHAVHQSNQLEFPYNIRQGLDVWRALYFDEGTFEPDPKRSELVNRGAYLVEGLGHCGECHTPRNALGAKDPDRTLQGAQVVTEGWYAPNITSDVQEGIGSWSQQELVTYLQTGSTPERGVAAGPMTQVIHESLSRLRTTDVEAIAAYLKQTPSAGEEQVVPEAYATTMPPGGDLYLSNCGFCHQPGGQGIPGVVPALDNNGSVTAAEPDNVIRVVLGGLKASGTYSAMPAFGADLSTEEIADVVNYVRTAWSNEAEPNAEPGHVAELAAITQVTLAGERPTCAGGSAAGAGSPTLPPPDDVVPLLQGIDDINMYDRIGRILNEGYPEATPEDRAGIVNGLAAAYCGAIIDDPRPDLRTKRQRYDRFAQLVYTHLAPPPEMQGGSMN